MSNNLAIGIDLGTTMSAIAKLDERGKPEIIPTNDGERIMPSAVLFSDYYDENGKKSVMIGLEAKHAYPANLKRGAKLFKREMSNPDYYVDIEGKKHSAIALSSIILKKLAKDAEKENGKVKDVVISVPAYFKEVERNATIEAGRLAGLNVVNIINEPTAAALYYVQSNNVNGKILIYDLGGGTFDVTILEVYENDIKVLSSEGDHKLGGVDFDNALLELFAEKYKKQTSEELYTTEEDKEELLLAVETYKKTLSKSQIVKARLVGEGGRATIEISREEFEEKISTYIARTELLTEQVFDSAGIEMNEIDEILLVGGSTRIPFVSRSIEETVGKAPINAVNVDEAVALGAAIKAGLIIAGPAHGKREKGITVQDVTNHSYGKLVIDYDEITNEEKMQNLIILEKNTPIPCTSEATTYTIADNQTGVRNQITQGEDLDPDYIEIIADQLLELPGGRSAGQELNNIYSYDANGIMKCEVIDVDSGRKIEITLDIKKMTENCGDIDSLILD